MLWPSGSGLQWYRLVSCLHVCLTRSSEVSDLASNQTINLLVKMVLIGGLVLLRKSWSISVSVGRCLISSQPQSSGTAAKMLNREKLKPTGAFWISELSWCFLEQAQKKKQQKKWKTTHFYLTTLDHPGLGNVIALFSFESIFQIYTRCH